MNELTYTDLLQYAPPNRVPPLSPEVVAMVRDLAYPEPVRNFIEYPILKGTNKILVQGDTAMYYDLQPGEVVIMKLPKPEPLETLSFSWTIEPDIKRSWQIKSEIWPFR